MENEHYLMQERATGAIGPTMLDVIRDLGRIDKDKCDSECSEWLHRSEVARVLFLLLDNPAHLGAFLNFASRHGQ